MDSKVKIIGYTDNPDRICASAARISTTMGDSLTIFEHSSDPDKNQALIKKVLASGHRTIIEHISFNLAFVNVSAYVEQFLLEFRLASFTVKSRRYVDFSNMGFVLPSFVDGNGTPLPNAPELEQLYKEHMTFLFQEYEDFVAAGIPKEDARFLLPYSYRSNFYCTVNARELCNILCAMLYGRGRKHTEVHALGQDLLAQAARLCPFIYDHLSDTAGSTERKNDKILELLKQAGNPEALREHSGPVSDSCPEHSVELLAHTGNPEAAVARAAWIAHTNLSAAAIAHLLKNETLTAQIIETVLADRRPRELEQIHFTFRINGISLAGITHLTRHRIQSILIPSFADVCRCERYLTPDTIKADKTLLQRYRDAYAKTKAVHGILSSGGLNKYEISYLYLSGNVIDITTTMNGRELLTFLSLRTCNRAQWETRRIAIQMLNLLRDVSPLLFCHFGPSCFAAGRCPEGKMTCGKFSEVQEQFRKPTVIL